MTRGIKILDRQFVPAGTLIIQQGTLGSRAFMVEAGLVEVFLVDEQGRELILTDLGPGAMVGEMAALSDSIRSASVRTKEDCVLITIPAHDLQASMKASDVLYKRLIRMMSARMKDTNMKLLQKENQLTEANKIARMSVENVAHYLAAKQDKLQREMAPVVKQLQSWDQFSPGDFGKE